MYSKYRKVNRPSRLLWMKIIALINLVLSRNSITITALSWNPQFQCQSLSTCQIEARLKMAGNWALPFVFRVKGTVIRHIWLQVLLMALYTTVVASLHNYVPGLHMTFPLTLIPVLGVVTGLLLVFRYWEGRCLFSKAETQIRHLTRLIWVGVDEGEEDSVENVQTVLEKTSAINLLVAFAYATKNYLREEYSYEEPDLKGLIGHLHPFRKFTKKPSGIQNGCPIVNACPDFPRDRRASRSGQRSRGYSFSSIYEPCATNIPIEISFYIYSYINQVIAKNMADGSCIYFMFDSLMTLVDCMTHFERILRTPIPLAYGVHLHQAVYLFLLALPYQLVGNLNWFVIPAVTMASFAFLGIMAIGREIENPFGYDDNDLPLDNFCRVIKNEIQMILGNPMPSLESWMHSKQNYPLAPASWLSAEELIKMPIHEIRNILAKGSEFEGELPEAAKWKKFSQRDRL